MKQTVSEALGVSGHVVLYTLKTREELVKLARDVMDRAEKYGANTPNEMNDIDKVEFCEIMSALGFKI